MAEEMTYSFLPPLLEQNYGVSVAGLPILLHERDGQRVFKVSLTDSAALTVRLCTQYRTHEKVLSDTGALLFLNHAEFPAPRLRLTLTGERAFQWQPGCWGYALDFIEGEILPPVMDLPTIKQIGGLLGRLHKLASSPADYPVQVGWLDELSEAIRRAITANNDPHWGKQAREIADNLSDLPDLRGLPLGLIHTDVHEGNLLRRPDGQLVMLDWEDAGLDIAIFDVAVVLGWHCVWQSSSSPLDFLKPKGPPERYDFDEEFCRELLSSYQQERPLSPQEMEGLGPAIRFVLGWFSSRDIERERDEPGVSGGLAFTHWAIMRSVTPHWSEKLARWAAETRPSLPDKPSWG